MSTCASQKQSTICPSVYQRRRPERTTAYQTVQKHLETWLALSREADPDNDPIPAYVERDLRKFLDCGILSRGFAYMDVGR